MLLTKMTYNTHHSENLLAQPGVEMIVPIKITIYGYHLLIPILHVLLFFCGTQKIHIHAALLK